jgi:hypothetical protein
MAQQVRAFAANFFTTFLILAHPYFHALLVFTAGRKFISPRAFCIPVRFRTTPPAALTVSAAVPASLYRHGNSFLVFFSRLDTSALFFERSSVDARRLKQPPMQRTVLNANTRDTRQRLYGSCGGGVASAPAPLKKKNVDARGGYIALHIALCGVVAGYCLPRGLHITCVLFAFCADPGNKKLSS